MTSHYVLRQRPCTILLFFATGYGYTMSGVAMRKLQEIHLHVYVGSSPKLFLEKAAIILEQFKQAPSQYICFDFISFKTYSLASHDALDFSEAESKVVTNPIQCIIKFWIFQPLNAILWELSFNIAWIALHITFMQLVSINGFNMSGLYHYFVISRAAETAMGT